MTIETHHDVVALQREPVIRAGDMPNVDVSVGLDGSIADTGGTLCPPGAAP